MEDDYETPACCPDGLIKWYNANADTCCLDNLAENPYRCVCVYVCARTLVGMVGPL